MYIALFVGLVSLTSCWTQISLAVPSAWLLSAKRAAAGLDGFIAGERPIALQSVLSNIGVKAIGADRGVIVASPSKEDPDCKLHIVSASLEM